MHNSVAGINLRQGDKVKEGQYNELTIPSHNRHCIWNAQQKLNVRTVWLGMLSVCL